MTRTSPSKPVPELVKKLAEFAGIERVQYSETDHGTEIYGGRNGTLLLQPTDQSKVVEVNIYKHFDDLFESPRSSYRITITRDV